MRFRLTYDGPIRPSQSDGPGAPKQSLSDHKHCMRREFHKQLRQLWKTNNFLKQQKVHVFKGDPSKKGSITDLINGNDLCFSSMAEYLSLQYQEYGYKFVPLVREEWSLHCSLNILFLRRDIPGGVITSSGDLDNRIKTVIDALRRPKRREELGTNTTPLPDETPFYCLLEDDQQVSHFEVESDTLLSEPTANEAVSQQAKIVVTVELRSYETTPFNLNLI